MAWTALERGAVEVHDVAEHPGHLRLRHVALGVPVAVPGQELEGARVGSCEHVALLDPAEAVDRRSVEGHSFVERVLELGRGDREGLRRPEDVGEPELDEADAAFFHRPEDVLLLAPDHVRYLVGDQWIAVSVEPGRSAHCRRAGAGSGRTDRLARRGTVRWPARRAQPVTATGASLQTVSTMMAVTW